MQLALQKIKYEDLNSRQQENYNFQKISAVLADYGYQTIRLTDDWNGADFLAQHVKDTQVLRVQLKSRLCFYKKYTGGDLWICFRYSKTGQWYLYPHDTLLDGVKASGTMADSESWAKGGYSFPHLSAKNLAILAPYKLEA